MHPKGFWQGAAPALLHALLTGPHPGGTWGKGSLSSSLAHRRGTIYPLTRAAIWLLSLPPTGSTKASLCGLYHPQLFLQFPAWPSDSQYTQSTSWFYVLDYLLSFLIPMLTGFCLLPCPNQLRCPPSHSLSTKSYTTTESVPLGAPSGETYVSEHDLPITLPTLWGCSFVLLPVYNSVVNSQDYFLQLSQYLALNIKPQLLESCH